MSTNKTYSYGLSGIAPDVTFGKNGPHLTVVGGTIQATSDGTTLQTLQAADPVVSQDLVTLGYLNGVVTGGVHYRGTFDASTGVLNPLDPTPANGDLYRVTVAGNLDPAGNAVSSAVGDFYIYNGTTWDLIVATDPTITSADNTVSISATSPDTFDLSVVAVANSSGVIIAQGVAQAVGGTVKLEAATGLGTVANDDALSFTTKGYVDSSISGVTYTAGNGLSLTSNQFSVNLSAGTALTLDGTSPTQTLGISGGTAGMALLAGGTGVQAAFGQLNIAGGTNVTGTLATTNGGTGLAAYTTGDTLYASASNVLSALPIGTTGQVLTVAGGVPSWASPATSGTVTTATNEGTGVGVWDATDSTASTLAFYSLAAGVSGIVTIASPVAGNIVFDIDQANLNLASIGGVLNLTSQVTGVLPVTNGGTGLNSTATGDLLYGSAADTYSSLAIGTTGQVLTVAGGVPTWTTSTALSNAFSSVSDGTNTATATGASTIDIVDATNGGMSVTVSQTSSTVATASLKLNVADLASGAAVSASDVFPVDQGAGTLKVTAAQLKTYVTSGLNSNEIISTDTFSSVDVGITNANGATIKASTGTAANTVATFTSGASSTSTLVVDNSTAGEITLSATGTNQNVHIVPSGTGALLVGSSGSAGVIESETGQALSVLGGAAASGSNANGANLTLGGGAGDGTGSLGLLLATTGTDAALTTNYSSASNESLVTLGTLKAKIAGIVVDTLVRRQALTTTASQNVGAVLPATSYMTRFVLVVTTPYTAGATFSLSDGTTTFMTDTDVNLEVNGTYVVDYYALTSNGGNQLTVTIGGSPTSGAATVIAEYKTA